MAQLHRNINFYRLTYETFYKRSDLFSLFVDLASDKLTKKGRISFIIPSIVLTNLSYKILRERLLSNNWLEEVCYTGGKVFSDATVDTVVITINKKKIKNIRLCNALDFINIKMQVVALDYFEAYQNTISIGSSESNSIFEKLFNSSYTTVDEHFNVFQGIVTGNNESYIFEDEEKIKSSNVDKSLLKPILLGRDISKWLIKDNTKRILYLDGKTEIDNFPNTKEWLTPFKAKLELRRECRKGVIPWYSLQWPREKLELDKTPKILLQRTRNESLKTRIVATLDETGIYGMESLIFLTPKSDKVSAYYFIAILNSKLINYLFATKFLNLAVKGDYLKKLQFPIIEGSLTLIDLSKKMLHFTQNLNDLVSNVIGLLQTKFPSLIVNQKLSNWYELEKTEFLKELKKGKVNLSLTEESEWIQYFKEQKEKWQNLKSELEETDRQIDKTVYLMYGLNDEEIKIVEESV